MGKDFISLKENGYDLKIADKLLKPRNVIEASKEKYFYVLPDNKDIEDIWIGTSGTEESEIKLKDGGFITVKGTIKLKGVI